MSSPPSPAWAPEKRWPSCEQPWSAGSSLRMILSTSPSVMTSCATSSSMASTPEGESTCMGAPPPSSKRGCRWIRRFTRWSPTTCPRPARRGRLLRPSTGSARANEPEASSPTTKQPDASLERPARSAATLIGTRRSWSPRARRSCLRATSRRPGLGMQTRPQRHARFPIRSCWPVRCSGSAPVRLPGRCQSVTRGTRERWLTHSRCSPTGRRPCAPQCWRGCRCPAPPPRPSTSPAVGLRRPLSWRRRSAIPRSSVRRSPR